MDKVAKIFLAGHTGLVGSSILRKLKENQYTNIIVSTHQQLDLRQQSLVEDFFREKKPQYVILSAALVGGIRANITNPTEFLYDNLMIQNNVIYSSYKNNVEKLLFVACGCAYPTNAPQPMKEEYLLTGLPEPTNEGFALSKLTGIKLCEKIFDQYKRCFISCIPANTYGPNDHFDQFKSHVIPGLIKKVFLAKRQNLKQVDVWGTGKAIREFIYVDDLAEAILLLMNKYHKREVINIGSGQEITIKDLVFLIKEIVGYKGKIIFDKTKPDGMKRRFLNSSKLQDLGFTAKTDLKNGLKKTYDYFLQEIQS